MTNRDTRLTRRRTLLGIGAVGFATTGLARGQSTGSWSDYADYTYAQTDGRRLLVGWQATYNGSGAETVVVDGPVDATDFVDGVTGVRLVDLDDVLPGDEGTASVGLRVEDGVEEGLRAWLRLAPEVAGDPASQEFADRLRVTVRYDDGLLGVGSCEGADGPFAEFGTLIFSGSFADLVDTDLADGIPIDPGLLGSDCLAPGDRRCLVIDWAFPPDDGNAGKGGGVAFDVELGVDPCGADATDPFDTEVST